ncbi:calponin homology domain-containing protein DDB_G0272472-like isoform X1 [Micropterus dolomieu]|uniref:calponin homology domain-containing protein DDB_G0272472-like isoform X1 n=1 Tax=Micropterus dolomieu TaxID=147949 RepID=UPI001E8CA30F|nr:calponin homology domain-containing protein DDB_G0272472-like isoform X1 [Micropterus dolomieu]
MLPRQQIQLQNEMEIVKSIRKLTLEERRKELRREMFSELKEMDMERRTRADLEVLQGCRREKEDREKKTEGLKRQNEEIDEETRRQGAKQREEEVNRAHEQKALEKQKQDQLKKERLRWKKVMMVVEEEPISRPSFALSDLEKEQQRRCEEAELCLTSELKGQEQRNRKTLFNNWVGEQGTESETDEEKLHSHGYTHPPSTEKASPVSESVYLISRPKSSEEKLRFGLEK